LICYELKNKSYIVLSLQNIVFFYK
jgi:hypothetical protein